MRENILIIGCGDIGKYVLSQLNEDKYSISVTSHRKTSQHQLEKLPINVIPANLDHQQNLEHLPNNNAYIFYFAPPPSTGTKDTRMLNFLTALEKKSPPKRIVYISTTGVYGDCQGEWITETAVINPSNDRSKRRYDAEYQLKQYCDTNECEFVILRVSGIYGPEKLPVERVKNGIKILNPNLSPSSNRIHTQDLTNCCIKAMFEGPANEIFNIADGNPSSISDYFIQIAKIFNLPPPELLDWQQAEKELSPGMLSYLHESKKINNEKLLEKLNINLEYPTLSKGLEACKKSHQNSDPD